MFYEKKELPIRITDEQRTALEKRNAEIDIATQVAGEELNRAKAVYKAATDIISKEKGQNLTTLRTGYENKLVSVIEYVNEGEALMEYFDEDNVLVHSRALTIDERRQLRINFNNQRQLTD